MIKGRVTLKATSAVFKEGKDDMEICFYDDGTHVFTMHCPMPNFKAGEVLTMTGVRMEVDMEANRG